MPLVWGMTGRGYLSARYTTYMHIENRLSQLFLSYPCPPSIHNACLCVTTLYPYLYWSHPLPRYPTPSGSSGPCSSPGSNCWQATGCKASWEGLQSSHDVTSGGYGHIHTFIYGNVNGWFIRQLLSAYSMYHHSYWVAY